MSDAVQHAATINSVIFILGFLAIVITGELLETRTALHRCGALFGIVLVAAAAIWLATPSTLMAAAHTHSATRARG